MKATRANCRDSFARACKVTGGGDAVVLNALSIAGLLLDAMTAEKAFEYAIGKSQVAIGGEGTYWRQVAIYCADVVKEDRPVVVVTRVDAPVRHCFEVIRGGK